MKLSGFFSGKESYANAYQLGFIRLSLPVLGATSFRSGLLALINYLHRTHAK
jgi:hypothetical protein